MSHDQVYLALARIGEICFWVLVISMPLVWCGLRAMVALSRRLPPSPARDRLNTSFEELVSGLLKLGLVTALGPIIFRFVAQNTHAPWTIQLEGFAALLIWLQLCGMTAKTIAEGTNSKRAEEAG